MLLTSEGEWGFGLQRDMGFRKRRLKGGPMLAEGVYCRFHKHTLSFLGAIKVAIERARSKKLQSIFPLPKRKNSYGQAL